MKIESRYVVIVREDGARMRLDLQSEAERAKFLGWVAGSSGVNVEAIAVDVIERRAA